MDPTIDGSAAVPPKPLSAADSISPAINQTKRQLFAPFRLQRWSRLAVVCLMIGDFAGGGGGGSPGNFNLPSSRPKRGDDLFAFPDIDWTKIQPWMPWIVAGAALVLALILLWIYIASVYRFVLFDSVLYDRCELKGSWGRWESYGRSFFFWSLALFAALLLGDAVIVGAPLAIAWRSGLFRHPSEHLAVLILGGAAFLFLMFVFLVVGAVAGLFAKDFCLPIMAMENVGVLDAWRRLLPMLATEKWAYAFYVLMKIVLAIASAIIFGIIILLVMIFLFIVLGIAGVIVFFAGKAIGLTINPATICILVVLGGIPVSAILYLVAIISTPAMVFFQSYALHFFGSRYPALGAVVFPPTETPPRLPLGANPVVEPSIG